MLSPSSEQDLWDRLIRRPTIAVPVPILTTSQKIYTAPCILDGWIFRESTGAASALVEIFDGLDTTGYVVGEQFIPAPVAGAGVGPATDVDASSATPAAANNVTLPGAAGLTTFITGFEITGDGATAAGDVTVTVTGILGGTKSYHLAIPLVAAPSSVGLQVEFTRPIPASAVNTAIVVNVPSFGAGNTFAAVTAHGFQQAPGASGASLGQSASGPGGLNYLLCRSGIFLNVLSGSIRGSVWIKA